MIRSLNKKFMKSVLALSSVTVFCIWAYADNIFLNAELDAILKKTESQVWNHQNFSLDEYRKHHQRIEEHLTWMRDNLLNYFILETGSVGENLKNEEQQGREMLGETYLQMVDCVLTLFQKDLSNQDVRFVDPLIHSMNYCSVQTVLSTLANYDETIVNNLLKNYSDPTISSTGRDNIVSVIKQMAEKGSIHQERKKVTEFLLKSLQDPSFAVRERLIEVMTVFQDPVFLPSLEEIAKNDPFIIRKTEVGSNEEMIVYPVREKALKAISEISKQ